MDAGREFHKCGTKHVKDLSPKYLVFLSREFDLQKEGTYWACITKSFQKDNLGHDHV